MLSWLFILLSSLTWAFEIPQNLNSDERQRTLEIVGLGTSTKFLSNAYPLGGYSGLEVSLSYEALDVGEITRLGNTSPNVETVYYPKFNIGKGIYNNSDIFFHFIPFNETSGLSKYGFSFRWSFYESLYLPINFSLVTHASNSNIQNKLVSRSLGADILLGLTLSNFSLSLGGGWVRTTGDFTGGTQGVTDDPT
ncbi:MAG: hypothetical protein HRT44_02280, partial [Bdellovibrionales bacterium]|nr:hypothetical protein [Bdellovibrionales bacterium]NQZ18074.1 hypothetical protein [Bdellovibrionales bacterium]